MKMNSFSYYIWLSTVQFCHEFKINVILIVSMALGLLFPIFCLGNINVFVQNIETMRIQGGADTIVLTLYGVDVAFQDVQRAIQNVGIKSADFALIAYCNSTVDWNDERHSEVVYYTTENITDFEMFVPVAGESVFSKNQNTCIIEKADLEQYGELSIGDTVTVDGQAYKLAGVYSSVRNNGKIFLPLAPQTSKGALQYSRIYFRNTQQSDLERLCTALETIGLKVRSVRNGEQDFQKLLSQCIQQSVLIFSAGAVSLLFAGLNIGLVLTGKILHNKRLIGIHMALGSSYSTELFSALVENLLCFAAAFILDLVLVQLLRPTVPQTFALALTAGVYIGAFVFGAGMVLLVTWATMRNLKRRKLVELMERVS